MTHKLFVLFALAWLAVIATAQAQTPPHQAEIDALMSRYTGDVPGASLLVVKDGKPIIERGYGYANLEKHVKAGPGTNYRLASVTKQFTAASILLLKQDGKLKLTDPIRKYLPELPASDDKITIENLLTHTSGLVDYEDLIPPDRTSQINDDDVRRMIASRSEEHTSELQSPVHLACSLLLEKKKNKTIYRTVTNSQ